MKTKTDISSYIVNVQGKDYITFPGLLAEAHAQGLEEISTQLIEPFDLSNPIIKATVKLNNKIFTGYGDANINNVAKKVAGALIRMAETRAVARALRFACNIDMTALEELDVESSSSSKKENTSKIATASIKVAQTNTTPVKLESKVQVENNSPSTSTTVTPEINKEEIVKTTKIQFAKRQITPVNKPSVKTEPNF